MLSEMQWYIVFPTATARSQLTTLLSTYGGMDKKDINNLVGLPSRWVAYGRTFPQLIVYEGGAYMLHTSHQAESAIAATGKRKRDAENSS